LWRIGTVGGLVAFLFVGYAIKRLTCSSESTSSTFFGVFNFGMLKC
jgi:hypothetical protein